ncbi:hypothetical protein I6E29_08205 [Arcanobacterium haemolyticum]|nr:hypothetical protein [Arcanobacterium haemolyticum]
MRIRRFVAAAVLATLAILPSVSAEPANPAPSPTTSHDSDTTTGTRGEPANTEPPMVTSSAEPGSSAPPSDENSGDNTGGMGATYISDADPDVTGMLEGYAALDDDVLDMNLTYVIEAQAGASSSQKARAVKDINAGGMAILVDALGGELAGAIERGSNNGELPRTTALLSRDALKAGTPSIHSSWGSIAQLRERSSAVRPVFAAPDQVARLDGIDYDSLSPQSFPSDHAMYTYEAGYVLATLVPEIGPQIIAHAAVSAESGIIAGLDSPLDVMAGRAIATRIVTSRWSDEDFRGLVESARDELRTYVGGYCANALGYGDLASCFAASIANGHNYETHQALTISRHGLTFNFSPLDRADPNLVIPNGAENLLATTFPELTDSQRRQVLALTAIPAGYPLDPAGALVKGTDKGWARIDLAAAMAAKPEIKADGRVVLSGLQVSVEGAASDAPTDSSDWFEDIGSIFEFPVAWLALGVFCVMFISLVVLVFRRRRDLDDE